MEAEPHQIGKGTVWIRCLRFARVGRCDSSLSGSASLVAAAVFGIALAVSDDLRLLYVSGALLFAVAAFLLGAKAQEDWIAAVLLLFASTFLFAFFVLPQTPLLWPTASVVGGDCHVAAIPEAICQNYHNRWGYDLNRGLSLVLRVLHSGADAARVNARGQWRGAAIHFATNQPESGADSLYTRQNSRARLFRHLVFSMYC